MNSNDTQYEDQSATGRWTATPETDNVTTTDSKPDGILAPIPKAAVVAWAAGPGATPSGRRGKKIRRRTRRIAAALAVIFVMSTVGTTGAFAQSSFYKASPHVDNEELVDAGAKSFDGRLAIGEPESTPNAPAVATNLEDAILTGGLSPGKMHMPDMMLAGISGDEMALAAAADDNSPMADGAADGGAKPDEQAARPTDDTPPEAGGDSTVGDLAKNASDENPDGYASPALGGDPEPIVDEYAQPDGGSGGEPATDQEQASQPPVNTELAGADPAGPGPSGTDTQTQAQVDAGAETGAGTDAPTGPTAPVDGDRQKVNEEPEEAEPQSDKLAVIQPPVSNEGASEKETASVPADQTVPTETTPVEPFTEEPTTEEPTTEEPTTEEPTTEEPSEVEGSGPADQVPDGEPDDEAEQAFADPSVTDEDYEDPPADEQPAGHPSTGDPSADGGLEQDDGSSELAATPLPAPSEAEPVPGDTEPDESTEQDDSSMDQASVPPDEDLSDQTLPEVGPDDETSEEKTVPEEPDQEQEADPGEEQAASTASINQSSSMQVFADEGSSAEAHSTQVAAINSDGETDQNSLSYPPDQGADNGRVPETHGDPTNDKGAEDEEYAAAEPTDNDETTTAEDPSVSEEGQAQLQSEGQGDPASDGGQNSETPPPTGTEPGATDTTAEETGQGPQELDNQNQQRGTPQNTTPQSGDPQDELPNAGTTGAEDSSPQEAPARVSTEPAQPANPQTERNQSEPARQLDGSGEPEPDNPDEQQPGVRQDSAGQTNLAPGTKPAVAAQQTPGGTETPNASEPTLPPGEGREQPNEVTRPDSSTEVPAGPGKQGIQPQAGGDQTQPAGRPSGRPINPPVPQQQVQQQQQSLQRGVQQGVQQVEEQVGDAVEEQSFSPDPASGEVEESEPTAPADPLLDGSAAGIEPGPSPGAVDGTVWADQPTVPTNQQTEVAGQTYMEPTVEPAPTQSWEQPVPQDGVNESTGLPAEMPAATDQTSVSQNTYESEGGVSQEAADPYAGEGPVITEAAPDPGAYNTNSYSTNKVSGDHVDPGVTPVDGAYAAPAVEESYPSQDTATSNYDPGYETQDVGTYGEAQEVVPVESTPTHEETYQEVSAQVPAQELESAPQVASQTLEPAPQVTNTLAGESSVAPSVAPSSGTSGAASPATGAGESQPSVDAVVQDTTSSLASGADGGQE